MRLRSLLALLLALLIPAASAGAQEAQAALEKGLTLRTIVTAEADCAALCGDEAAGGALSALLENSRLILWRQWQDDGPARLASFEWELQGVPVVDLTCMRAGNAWYEQSSLLGGRALCVRDASAGFAVAEGLRAAAADWARTAFEKTRAPLADMVSEIAVLTHGEVVALLEALCACLEQAGALLPEAALTGALGQEGLHLWQAAAEKIARLPQWLASCAAIADGAAVFCVDHSAAGEVLARQAELMLPAGMMTADWTPAKDGGLGSLTAQGIIAGREILLEIDRSAGSRTSVEASLRIGTGETALLAEMTDVVSGSGKSYSRKTDVSLAVEEPGRKNSLLSIAARTSVKDETLLRPDEAETMLYPAEMTAEETEAFLALSRGDLAQTAFTILGRLPEKTAEYVQTRMGLE